MVGPERQEEVAEADQGGGYREVALPRRQARVGELDLPALAYALEEGALIRVNVVLSRLHGKARRGVEMVSVLATLGLTCFVAYYFWRDLSRNFTRGAVSESIAEIPLWIPQSLVFTGLALFAIQLFAYFLRLASGGPPISKDQVVE